MPATALKYIPEIKTDCTAAGSAVILSFEQLFKLHYAKLSLFANKYLNDLEASEEVVSDTFAWLWERHEQIEINSSMTGYLYKAVQNRCLNYLKHKKIENEYVSYLLRNRLLNEDADASSERFMEKELNVQVGRAIEALPPRCREIFKLSRFEKQKNKDIARILNISTKAVERQMTIALERLRHGLRHLLPLLVFFFLH